MCKACDPQALLDSAGVEATGRRRLILEIMLDAGSALSPREILERLADRGAALNKVTLYRVLDLFVEQGLIERHSSGDRSFRYCVAGVPNHPRHHHFFCLRCGAMRCLDPDRVRLQVEGLEDASVEKLELRLDGVCADCRRAGK